MRIFKILIFSVLSIFANQDSLYIKSIDSLSIINNVNKNVNNNVNVSTEIHFITPDYENGPFLSISKGNDLACVGFDCSTYSANGEESCAEYFIVYRKFNTETVQKLITPLDSPAANLSKLVSLS